jgi:hypothetical protein
MKREFAFDEALRMLEVTWSSLPKSPRQDELGNWDIRFFSTGSLTEIIIFFLLNKN